LARCHIASQDGKGVATIAERPPPTTETTTLPPLVKTTRAPLSLKHLLFIRGVFRR